MTKENIEIGIIRPGGIFTILSQEKIGDFLEEVISS